MGPLELILSLLSQDEPLTDEQIAEMNAAILELEDAQLAEAETELVSMFNDQSAAENIDAEALARLTQVADVIDATRTESASRYAVAEEAERIEAEAAAETQRQLDELQARVSGGPDPDDGDGDPPAGDEDTDGEVTNTPVADGVPAEEIIDPELVPAGNAPGNAVQPATRTATRTQVRERTPARNRGAARQPRHQGRVTMRGTGGHAHEYDSRSDIERDLIQRYRDLEGTTDLGRFRVATINTEYPQDRQFAAGRMHDVTDIVDELRAKVYEDGGVDSLVADGGICGPVEFWYGQTNISQASRPLRSAITGYQVKRGGLGWTPSMTIADIRSATTPTSGNAIGVVTEAQDAASTYDKSFQTITCGTPVEKRVDAVYEQYKFGNFYDRTNPEGKSHFLDLGEAAFARFNEQRLFNAMVANSLATHAPQRLGALRDFLTAMNRWAINRRAQYRMPEQARIDVVIPGWVGDGLLPDDQTNALQSEMAQFGVTRSDVETWLGKRNINVINWFQDDFTTAVANGAMINNYPTNFTVIGFHPGAHVYIDQGELNVGVVRDSPNVANNTFQIFDEEFWTTGMWGVWSHAITFSLCANGASAGSRTPTCGS